MTKSNFQRGYGSLERPLIGVLWDRDSAGPDEALKAGGNYEPDNRHVDFHRYYDAAYFKEEIEKIWKKQWLFACREEEIPEIGDRLPFNVGSLSFIIVRSKSDAFKAFYNSCLHRGTMLCAKPESSATIRCPFHGWEWNVDGGLKRIPDHWDFTEITPKTGALREVKLSRWGGFIFINADPDCAPLEETLSIIPEHFKDFGMEERYTAAHFRKLVPANWKIVQEAFMESYHLSTTHPQAIPFSGDSQTQYDIWTTPNGAIGRNAVPSMHAPPDSSLGYAAAMSAESFRQWHYPDAEPPPAWMADQDPRAQLGAWHRKVFEQTYGRKQTGSDSLMMDAVLYFVFPHFCPWRSEGIPIVYQFMPHETDPNMSYFEVRLLKPVARGQQRPPGAPPIIVGIAESIEEKVPGFGFLAPIFDQDMSNMSLIQRGVQAADPARTHAQLGVYQESLIQHWHELFDRVMAR
jgi:phenylpropionate dioxygenase-like ring-hydroxylating dioxygenase large terminal subunit